MQTWLAGGESARGEIFGGRRVVSAGVIARSTSSVVFDVLLDDGSRRALKVLAASATREERDRFALEAALLGEVAHANVVRLERIVEDDRGVRALVMPLLRGETLRSLLGRGPVDPAMAIRLVTGAAAGLAAIHKAGFVHRDLKPSNVFVGVETTAPVFVRPRAIVLDLGLARSTMGDGLGVTTETAWRGTLAYLAPEQLLSGRVDARTDVWALGLILYECLTGARAFADDARDVLDRDPVRELFGASQAGDNPLRPFETVLRKSLSKRPADRFATVNQLAAGLASIQLVEAT